jgi:putative (di)nucleoside polyphosphate hydrolase
VKDAGYRPAVGVMLINAEGKVWVGQRLDNSLDAWQMPQGGLDPGEDPLEGALRELEELYYDLPEDLIGKVWKEPWRGQRQTWFLARFLGTDSDVDIATPDPEFRAWKWAEASELPAMIVPFKKTLYEAVLAAFRDRL